MTAFYHDNTTMCVYGACLIAGSYFALNCQCANCNTEDVEWLMCVKQPGHCDICSLLGAEALSDMNGHISCVSRDTCPGNPLWHFKCQYCMNVFLSLGKGWIKMQGFKRDWRIKMSGWNREDEQWSLISVTRISRAALFVFSVMYLSFVAACGSPWFACWGATAMSPAAKWSKYRWKMQNRKKKGVMTQTRESIRDHVLYEQQQCHNYFLWCFIKIQ